VFGVFFIIFVLNLKPFNLYMTACRSVGAWWGQCICSWTTHTLIFIWSISHSIYWI